MAGHGEGSVVIFRGNTPLTHGCPGKPSRSTDSVYVELCWIAWTDRGWPHCLFSKHTRCACGTRRHGM